MTKSESASAHRADCLRIVHNITKEDISHDKSSANVIRGRTMKVSKATRQINHLVHAEEFAATIQIRESSIPGGGGGVYHGGKNR